MEDKQKVQAGIAEISKLLAMTPDDGSVRLIEPMTEESMDLSRWLDEVRDRFLGLSTAVGRALDIPLQ